MTRPGLSFDADYLLDDIVAAEPWHFWFRARCRLMLWALRFYFPRLRSLLDVGCGTGFVLDGRRRASPDLALAGCDVRLDAVCRARQRLHDVRLFQADFRPRSEVFDGAAELRISGVLNAAVAALLQPEWLLIRAGASLPIGGSLMVVAQRPLS